MSRPVLMPAADVERPTPAVDSDPSERPHPHRLRSLALVTLAIVVVLAGLRLAAGVIIPLILSVLAAFALDPVVSFITRLVRSRALAAGITVGGLVCVLGGSAYAMSDDFIGAATHLPEATDRLRLALRDLRRGGGPLNALGQAADNIEAAASEATGRPQPPAAVSDRVWTGLGIREWLVVGSMSVIGFAGQFLLLVFFVYFLLASGDLFKRKLVRVFGPALSARRVTLATLEDLHRSIRRFVLVMVATDAMVAVASFLAFWAIGLEHAAVWGILGGALSTIPYVGGAVTIIVVFLAALLQFNSMEMGALAGGLFLLIATIEGTWLKPWLMGRAARLNNSAVFAGLIFWGWLWGAWGMLLAFPILMLFKSLASHVDDLAPLGELLGE
jgi:predicted PurR-regulated permease PerM